MTPPPKFAYLLGLFCILGLAAYLIIPPVIEQLILDGYRRSNPMGQISRSHFAIAMAAPKPKKIGIYENGARAQYTNEWAIDLAKKGGVNISLVYFTGKFEPMEDMHEVIYDPIKKTVNQDFSSVEEFDVSKFFLKKLAATDRAAFTTNPRIRIAIVADDPSFLEPYVSGIKVGQWPLYYFDKLEDVRTWLVTN